MTCYAIGDIQGCHDELLRLLDKIKFDPVQDQIWFAGDLVNRGPKSLETLRFVKSLGNSAVSVLGNHDLHLLASAYAKSRRIKYSGLDRFLSATDCEELLFWLRHRPFLHHEQGFTLVHAGLPPQWDLNLALEAAHIAENALRALDFQDLLENMYGNQPDCWSPQLQGMEKIRFILNCFTRMRYCEINGRLDFEYSCAPGEQPSRLIPWYNVPGRLNASLRIVFGHWSSLGFHSEHNCFAIDSGCLWGGCLTALRLDDDPKTISIKCPGYQKVGKN